MPRPGPSVTSGADLQPGSDSLFPSGFTSGGARPSAGSVGTGELADGSVAAADLNLSSVAAALAARQEFTGTYGPRTDVRRGLLRAVPAMPLYPVTPTIALSASNAATGITSGVDIANSDASLRYSACNGNNLGAAWYRVGITPNGSSLDQGSPWDVDFVLNSADFEIRLAGQSANRGYRLWIDGQPVTTSAQAGPGASGGTHRLRVTLAGRETHHYRIRTNAGIVGLTVGPADTVAPAAQPLYSGRLYALGDSFTSGAGTTYQQDGYLYIVADLLGLEPLSGGQLGTGYGTNGGGSGGRDTFANRALADLAALTTPLDPKRDAILVYGGTNDSTTGLQTAAATTYANLATRCPGVPVYVFGCQYPAGGTDTTRDTKDASIQAAALAASNVVKFTSVKTWVTTGNASVITSGDALHPTFDGHRIIGRRMFDSIVPVFAAQA